MVNPEDCRDECLTAAIDGGVVRVTKQGSVDINVVALGVVNTIRLLDVQYAANLERNIIPDDDKNLKCHLGGSGSTSTDMRVECWSDADFAADKSDRKSVSGCLLTMDDSVVLWLCKKQSGVLLSTMEAEFIAASQAGRELLGMKELLN